MANSGIILEYGDVIDIDAPTNAEYHNNTFFIYYIDETKIKIANVSTFAQSVIYVDDDGAITDLSIKQIRILKKAPERGFARQNGLLPGQRITINFSDVKFTSFTGTISNLEEDEIEITSDDRQTTIFIDFKYSGLPEDLPIETIIKREPLNETRLAMRPDESDINEDAAEDDATIINNGDGTTSIKVREDTRTEPTYGDFTDKIYYTAIDMDEDLGVFEIYREVVNAERKYGIELQLSDLTDKLLANIPNNKRTNALMQSIARLCSRIRQLRLITSKFDEGGAVIGIKTKAFENKPLIDHILAFDASLHWILPVINYKKTLFYDKVGVAQDLNNIYDIDTPEYTLQSQDELLSELDQLYKTNVHSANIEQGHSQYDSYYRSLLAMFDRPTTNAIEYYGQNISTIDAQNRREDVLLQRPITIPMTTLAAQKDDFQSTTGYPELIDCGGQNVTVAIPKLSKFVTNRAVTGLNRLDSSRERERGFRVYTNKKITYDDDIALKSIVFMPEPVLQYSRVQLPSTNILDRSNLAHIPLELERILNQSSVVNYVIDDLSKELYGSDVSDESVPKLLSSIVHFTLDRNIERNEENVGKFLNVILPQIIHIINLAEPYLANKCSLYAICSALEPFMIYTDELTFGQYKTLRAIAKNNITQLNEHIRERADQFFSYISFAAEHKEKNGTYTPLSNIFLTNKRIHETCINTYDTKNAIGSEELAKYVSADCAILFTLLLRQFMAPLVIPDDLSETLLGGAAKNKTKNATDMSIPDISKSAAAAATCNTRFLAKHYTSRTQMLKDNDPSVELFFDAEFDDTPYNLLAKYKTEQTKYTPTDFLKFFAEILIQKHDCPQSIAPELAETIVRGKRTVEDGHYAMVDDDANKNDPEAEPKYNYYIRKNGAWVYEPNMDDVGFMDDQTLFCNIDKQCFKNIKSRTCDAMSDASKRTVASRAMAEAELRINKSLDEMQKSLEEQIAAQIVRTKSLDALKYIDRIRQDVIAVNIGKTKYEQETIVRSPFEDTYQHIIGIPDFVERQTLICKLVDMKCREPSVEHKENPYWMYCRETNLPLVPKSLFILASTFISGGNYALKLAEVCSKYGTLSDDGEAIIDKHCGCQLKLREFAEDFVPADYDEAMIIEEVILPTADEKDPENEATTATDIIPMTPETRAIAAIVDFLCDKMYIPKKPIENTTIRLTYEIMYGTKPALLTREKYDLKMRREAEKADRKITPISYELYFNQIIVYSTTVSLLAAVQFATPPLQIKKTFPNCVKSFSGFPFDESSEGGLTYFGCVLDKVKSSIDPWSGIEKTKLPNIIKNMRETATKYLITQEEFIRLHTLKENWLAINGDNSSPTTLITINNLDWFSPPLVDFSVDVKPLPDTLKADLKESLTTKNTKHTMELIERYRAGIRKYSLATIEAIANSVRKKNLLLRTRNFIPYHENSCCNEPDKPTKPIEYFLKENPEITKNIDAVQSYAIILKNVNRRLAPNMFYNNENTRMPPVQIAPDFTENNRYAAFIHHMNMDNPSQPVPMDVAKVKGETKPAVGEYNSLLPLAKKIEAIKSAGFTATDEDLTNLMKTIARRTADKFNPIQPISPITVFSDVIEHFHAGVKIRTSIAPENVIDNVCEYLKEICDNFEPDVLHKIGDESKPLALANKKLFNFLTNQNENDIKYIMDTLRNDLTNAEHNHIYKMLNKFTEWPKSHSITEQRTIAQNILDDILLTGASLIENKKSRITLNSWTHWGFENKFMSDLSKRIADNSDYHYSFAGNAHLIKLFKRLKFTGDNLKLLLKTIPIAFARDVEQVEFLTEDNQRELIKYCVNSAIALVLFNSTTQAHILDRNADDSDYGELSRETKRYIKEKLLGQYMIYNSLSLPYDKIANSVRLGREREKKRITDSFERKTKFERSVEYQFKQLSLEHWRIGKEVYKYNEAQYLKEREMREDVMMIDINITREDTDYIDDRYDPLPDETPPPQELDGEDGYEEYGNDDEL